MDPKPILQSKTVWFNAAVALFATAAETMPLLKDLVGGDIYQWLLFAVAFGNLYLRSITRQPVSMSL